MPTVTSLIANKTKKWYLNSIVGDSMVKFQSHKWSIAQHFIVFATFICFLVLLAWPHCHFLIYQLALDQMRKIANIFLSIMRRVEVKLNCNLQTLI